MKVPWFVAQLALPIFALSLAPPAWAENETLRNLQEFRKKVAGAEANSPNSLSRGSDASTLLRTLERLIARNDFEQARQVLASVEGRSLTPGPLEEEWSKLAERLQKDLIARQAEAQETWRRDVEQLVTDARTSCLDAKDASQLTTVMVRCAALQLVREQRTNIVDDRISRKLRGTASTLTTWANFLDLQQAGRSKGANDALRSLLSNESEFPVLSTAQIQSRMIPDAGNTQWRIFFPEFVKSIESPDGLPQALAKVKPLPVGLAEMDKQLAMGDVGKLEILNNAWTAIKTGDLFASVRALSNFRNAGFGQETKAALDGLAEQIASRQMQVAAQPWSKLIPHPKETMTNFMDRVMDEVQGSGDYPSLLDLMRAAEMLLRYSGSGITSLSKDIGALENFVSAQRLERAGDNLGAVIYYRMVVGAAGGKRVPTDKAETALKKIAETNPEVLKSAEGTLAEELRSLRNQLQILNRMQSSRPGMPFPQ